MPGAPDPAPVTPEGWAARIKARALEEGFSAAGICTPDGAPGLARRLHAFVEAGFHGEMGWMAERMTWRSDPKALWPEVRSVMMLAEAYTPDEDPLALLDAPTKGNVSVYARGRDYHDVVKKRLKRLGRWLVDEAGCEIKVFVDTAPVMEKPLAQAAGLGWQGKHTNLVSRALGNWFFLGAIYTTLDLAPDAPETDHCGSCRACLDACPTQAFPAPGQLDARRCISYLTIEHKGPIPNELRPALGNRIYGCDDCLAVCPWNKFAREGRDARYETREILEDPDLAALARLSDEAFRAAFSASPIKRIGRARFLRNVAYAIGNSADRSLLSVLDPLIADPDPVLSEAARWARARLGAAPRPDQGS